MFFVYGTSGQLFRGSMEQLRQIHGVGSLARARRSAAVGRDGRDAVEQPGSAFAVLAGLVRKDDVPRHPVVAAYSQTQQVTSQRHPLSTVGDVMSQHPITLTDSASVLDGWQLLAEKGVGQAPVVDAAGHLVGLLTRADLLKPERLPTAEQQVQAWQILMHQNVKDIMWTPVPSVGPVADLRRVAQVLLDTGLPGLPVVDEQGKVNGFVSRTDILRAVVNDPPLDLWG
ncbi:inosine-5'-monophosphate dehydrogenase [Rhodoferax lithotrophicus]|uniref:Inosine-5'-monophosphate dehydrogenase n=1 Tax=Rhodoferax lithotrophicus TaxID=2798804 RepID=A0ABM7MHA7_9BURK|nr:CBS domain-containing protein [Rhodoferax sp. MIZ03]BCO25607.1 inosine-5'-monophosphate dehydrogenase [Rhodoferax sp. MIZ03]